jgi:N-acetylmuramoyl-L-alanine amidase
MTRRIAISVGHGQKIRGASQSPNPEPYNDEVDECIKIVDRVHELLTESGHACVKFFDTVSTSQSQNLDRIVDWHNDQSRDLDVSCHLNANATTSSPMGCEVLYVTQENLAEQVSAAIAAAGHFKDRGEKYRGDLAFLNGTSKPSILLECWFCDSSADCTNGRKYREEICKAIAETIADVELDDVPERPPEPIEPPEPTEPPSGENRVEITGNVTGHVTVYINGTLVTGHEPCEHAVHINIKMVGDVTVSIQGEEFHNKEG